MEFFSIIFVWPFIIFALGIALISFSDVFTGGFVNPFFFLSNAWWIILGLFIYFLYARKKRAKEHRELTSEEQLLTLRKGIMILSIALLLPVFFRYLHETLGGNLFAVVLGLIIGFAFMVWGIMMKGNTTLMYSSLFGGGFILIYVYSKLWDLGDTARVLAAGLGLVFAVAIAIYKFKDKLA
ncbi:MAG: hypothetical protein Q8R08_02130 [bacterium]|nr:hypothetical protein [bacterium]